MGEKHGGGDKSKEENRREDASSKRGVNEEETGSDLKRGQAQ